MHHDSDLRIRNIENQARYLQLELWNRRAELWPRGVPTNPVDLLEPGVALKSRDYSIETVDFLGELSQDGKKGEAAGTIDRTNRIVSISARYPIVVQRFTAAHELGHAILHPNGSAVLRDRPLEGPTQRRDQFERDADRFASCFLMPAKQVRLHFVDSFRTERFELTDTTAFHLCRTSDVDKVSRAYRTTRDRSKKLSEAINYGGRPVMSLSTRFGVSTTAMAIRLEELDLVI